MPGKVFGHEVPDRSLLSIVHRSLVEMVIFFFKIRHDSPLRRGFFLDDDIPELVERNPNYKLPKLSDVVAYSGLRVYRKLYDFVSHVQVVSFLLQND
jgi:hypothetical protein